MEQQPLHFQPDGCGTSECLRTDYFWVDGVDTQEIAPPTLSCHDASESPTICYLYDDTEDTLVPKDLDAPPSNVASPAKRNESRATLAQRTSQAVAHFVNRLFH